MEKFLILLIVSTIIGTTVQNIIAASVYEKEGAKDEFINLQTKNNFTNLNRSERSSDDDEFPNISDEIKNILRKYVMMITAKQSGNPVANVFFTIDMDINIKSIHEIIPNGVIEKDRKLIAHDSTTVTNNDDFEQKIKSSEIIMKTIVTETATISNTFDMSGEVEIPSIPLIGSKGKVGFKFSKTSSTTNTKTEDISKKMPSQDVNLKPHSSRKIISELYGTDIIHNYLLSFEIDKNSTFALQFKHTPFAGIDSILIGIGTTINGHPNRIEGLNLKSALQEWAQATDDKYPTTAIYIGSTPAIQFENDKVYIKYFPLEVKTVKTELYSHIEKID